MYQVVITESNGEIHGRTFRDPIEAIQEFGRYFIDPKFDREGQIMFQEIGKLVVVLNTYRLTHGEVLMLKNGQVFVHFHSLSKKEDFIADYKKYAAASSENALDYVTGALIDLKTQEVVLGFNDGKMFGD